MNPAPPPATADELRNLLVRIVSAYYDLAEAELARPQRIDVLEAARTELGQCIEDAARSAGVERR